MARAITLHVLVCGKLCDIQASNVYETVKRIRIPVYECRPELYIYETVSCALKIGLNLTFELMNAKNRISSGILIVGDSNMTRLAFPNLRQIPVDFKSYQNNANPLIRSLIAFHVY